MNHHFSRRGFLGTVSAALVGHKLETYATEKPGWLDDGKFSWLVSPPLIAPIAERADPCHAIKDPTVIFFDKRWHLFCTIRSRKRTHQIEYVSFSDWNETAKAERTILKLTEGYFCAPQVFWFTPHKKWYMVYQVSEPTRKPALQPAFSTSDKLADAESWSKPTLVFEKHPDNVARWIDFWTIADDQRMHLFFTSLDGKMWRASTSLKDFPHGWSKPEIVLEGDIFEASHTYRLKGLDRFLTLVEAQAGDRRYYKAYLADKLDGKWQPLAATREKPFASPVNVRDQGKHWTDSFSHGELLRAGTDEHLEVDPAKLRFLFQGVSDEARKGKAYGDIPWQLGLLESG